MIIWIASYPKSGNTWVRSLISSYLFSEDGKFDFRFLNNIKQFSSKDFQLKLNKESNYQSRIAKNWIPTQKKINQDGKIHFYKTHSAICTINERKFTDKENTLAAIYMVRDPRSIITSLSHHYELTKDEAFDFLINKRKIIYPNEVNMNTKNRKPDDFNFLGDWANHYLSWKNINFCPIKIIKYEDAIINTRKVFLSTIDFLSKFIKIKINDKKIDAAISSTSFKKLRQMEKEQGFKESAISNKTKKKIKFFNLGKKNDWNLLLDKKLVSKIESHFKIEMRELGYL